MFEVPTKGLGLMGFFSKEKYLRYPRAVKYIHWFSFFIIITSIVEELSFISTNLSNVMAAAECMGALAAEIISLPKLLALIFYKDKFFELMERIRKLSDDYECSIPFKTQKFNKFYTSLFLLSTSLTGMSLCIAPVANDCFGYLFLGKTFGNNLPMLIWAPFNTSNSPGYEVIYLQLIIATYFTVYLNVS